MGDSTAKRGQRGRQAGRTRQENRKRFLPLWTSHTHIQLGHLSDLEFLIGWISVQGDMTDNLRVPFFFFFLLLTESSLLWVVK